MVTNVIEEVIGNLELYLQGSSALAYAAAYAGGLLVSFTPCIYPIIPILAAYTGARSGTSRARGFVLSVAYVLGMAVTYTVLGAFAALTGRLFGEVQSNPWTFFFFGNLCIFMGLSMLGVFSLSWQPGFAVKASMKERQGIVGSAVLGALSGIVVGPCTAPVCAVLLGYVASKQNVLFGISLFFVFSLGVGTLLVLVGAFTGILVSLPRSGEWMVRVKKIVGWVFIGTGEYFLITAGKLWF